MSTTPVLLSSYTASTGVSSIAINSIDQTYTDLLITLSMRGNISSGDTWAFDNFTINGVSTNTYSVGILRGFVGGLNGANTANSTSFNGAYSTGNSSEANSFGCGYLYIPNYASTSKHKNIRHGGYNTNNQSASYNNDSVVYWANAAAVISLLFTPVNGSTEFMTNSQINVYGI